MVFFLEDQVQLVIESAQPLAETILALARKAIDAALEGPLIEVHLGIDVS